MRNLFVFLLLAAAAALVVGTVLAGDPLDDLKPFKERIKRDCPACGFSWKTKKSNNKPSKAFKGVFEPGTKCPFCKGEASLYDTVDWQKGVITAWGVCCSEKPEKPGADAKARFAQLKLMSERGAKIEALRNAAAAALKVRFYGDKPLPSSYRRRIEAFVKGFEVEEIETIETGDRPAALAKVTVPLWGIKSVAGLFFDSERKRYVSRFGGRKVRSFAKVDEVDEDSYTEETVVIIDLRGQQLSPHMFPRIEDASGGAVYNMTHVSKKYVDEHGMVRYMFMETEEKTFEELKQGLESGSLDLSA